LGRVTGAVGSVGGWLDAGLRAGTSPNGFAGKEETGFAGREETGFAGREETGFAGREEICGGTGRPAPGKPMLRAATSVSGTLEAALLGGLESGLGAAFVFAFGAVEWSTPAVFGAAKQSTSA